MRRLSLSTALLVAAAAVATFLVVRNRPGPGRTGESGTSKGPVAEVHGELEAVSAAVWDESWPLLIMDHLTIGAESAGAAPDIGLRLWINEIVPDDFAQSGTPVAPGVAPGHHVVHHDFSASFQIRLLAARHANEFFVAGRAIGPLGAPDPEEFVIERWTIRSAEGAPSVSRPTSAVPIGQDAPPTQPGIEIVGGVYAPPSERDAPEATRRLVYRTELDLTALGADPDGRYLLLVSDEGVHRLDLVSAPPVLELVVPAAAVPEAAGASSLKGGVNAAGVKQFILGGGLGAPFVVLLDADNDAAFESTTVLGWAEALDSGLLEPAAWQDDLVSYASTGFF